MDKPKVRAPHYILSTDEIHRFIEIWNNRKEFPKVEDVIGEMHYAKNSKALNIARQLKDCGYSLVSRVESIISDADLMLVWNDTTNYPTISHIATKYNLAVRWISVRVCELRAIYGLDALPYRSHHKHDQRALKVARVLAKENRLKRQQAAQKG